MSNLDYQKLLAGLELRRMPIEEFARVLQLDGVRFASRARLNQAFRGEPLRDDTAEQVWSLWKELESMALETYASAPWAVLSFADGGRVHTGLQIFRSWQANFEALKGEDGKE